MTKRIDLEASETGPVLGAVLGYLENGSVDELVINRDGRPIARLTRTDAPAPEALVSAPTPEVAAVAPAAAVAAAAVSQPRAPRWSRPRREASGEAGRRSIRGTLAGLLLVAVVVAALAFVLAPIFAFFSLRSAALTSDAPGLEQLVDYSQVRAALRPQLSRDPRADEPAPSWLENPLEAARRTIEGVTMPDPNVDRYLTPSALAALSFGEGRYASERSNEGAPLLERNALDMPWPALIHWSPNRARFRVRDEGGSATVLTFQREGVFTWKLAHIGLPEGGLAGPAADPDAVPQAG